MTIWRPLRALKEAGAGQGKQALKEKNDGDAGKQEEEEKDMLLATWTLAHLRRRRERIETGLMISSGRGCWRPLC